MVQGLEAAETLSTGESRFRIQAVQNPLNKVPRKPRSPEARECTESIESLRWTVVREDDRERLREVMDDHGMIPEAIGDRRDEHLPDLARLAVENGGACIIGPAGVGKTHLINMIRGDIETQDPNANIVTMAFTHRAARIAGGSTVTYCLHKFRDTHNAWGSVHEFPK